MALNTLKCNHLTPMGLKGLITNYNQTIIGCEKTLKFNLFNASCSKLLLFEEFSAVLV